jgi:ribose transport system substrate-binding protein
MKRIKHVGMVLATVVALTVSACSTGGSTPPAGGTAPAADEKKVTVPDTPKVTDGMVDTTPYKKAGPYVIGVSNVSVANSFRVQMIGEFKEAAKGNSQIKDIVITDAGGDANKQIADIENLIAQKVDALLVAPASATAITPAVEEAYSKGIPVIIFNSDIESKKVVARVLPTYNAWAKQTADWLVKAIGGKGNIIALRGIAGLAAEADEWAGVQEALKAYPDVKIVGTEYADWDYGKAKTAMANILANKPQIDGVASIGDGMTWAAAEVMKSKGYDVAKIPMIGIGGSNGFLKYWKQNNVNGYVIADPTSISITALNIALDALQGKPIKANQAPDTIVIENSSLDKFVKSDLPDSAWVGTKLSNDALKSLIGK